MVDVEWQVTVAEVGGTDPVYAPPFSPVWDQVLLAAGKAAANILCGANGIQPMPIESAVPCRHGAERSNPV